MVLLWRSWHIWIVLTRPFLLDIVKNRKALDATNANDAVRRCINSAQECVILSPTVAVHAMVILEV